jgi:two-component system sensor kinase FixL
LGKGRSNLLDRQIARARRQLNALRQEGGDRPAARRHELFQLLATTLDDLQASAAGLRTQDAELVATRALVEAAVDGIVRVDERGIIASFNPAAERMFGYAAAQVVGKSIAVLMPSPHREQHREYLARYRRTGQRHIIGVGVEVPALRKDGTTFPIELTVSEVHDDGRRLFIGIVRDVTERKRAEAVSRESQERFAQFMEHLPGVAFIKDVDGRYVYVNKTFEDLFHRAAEDYVGQTDDEVWPGAIAAQLKANDELVARTGKVLQTTETIPHDDGLHYWLVTKFPIRNPDGTTKAVGGVAIDITERMRAEDAVRELRKQALQRERLADVGVITAKILHDLANPLAGLSMQAQLILRRARRDADQPLGAVLKPAEQIVAEVHRLDSLISDLMHFRREQNLELKRVEVAPLLQGVADLWQPLAATRGIQLSLSVAEDVPGLIADEEKLRRLFDNLVKNAVEAIDQGPGDVRILASVAERERVRIAVEDTGPGIAPTVQVFRLFETTKATGSGLGLAIAKQIVEAHGGRIAFTRMEPHGTGFQVELPCRGPASPRRLTSGAGPA